MKQKWWSVCFLTFCLSLRPHQGWASQTSSVNLGLLPSVSLSAAGLGGGRWALAENDPSGLIVFWPADWHWEEKQRRGEKERGGWVLMHLAAIREAYLAVWTQWANIYTQNVHTLKWLRYHPFWNFPLYSYTHSSLDTQHTHTPTFIFILLVNALQPPFCPTINWLELIIVHRFIEWNLNKKTSPSKVYSSTLTTKWTMKLLFSLLQGCYSKMVTSSHNEASPTLILHHNETYTVVVFDMVNVAHHSGCHSFKGWHKISKKRIDFSLALNEHCFKFSHILFHGQCSRDHLNALFMYKYMKLVCSIVRVK